MSNVPYIALSNADKAYPGHQDWLIERLTQESPKLVPIGEPIKGSMSGTQKSIQSIRRVASEPTIGDQS